MLRNLPYETVIHVHEGDEKGGVVLTLPVRFDAPGVGSYYTVRATVGIVPFAQVYHLCREDWVDRSGRAIPAAAQALQKAYETAPMPSSEDRLADVERRLDKIEGKSKSSVYERVLTPDDTRAKLRNPSGRI